MKKSLKSFFVLLCQKIKLFQVFKLSSRLKYVYEFHEKLKKLMTETFMLLNVFLSGKGVRLF